MKIGSVKQDTSRLLDNLPEKVNWGDLIYQVVVRQTIEAGIKDSDEGRTMDVQEVRKRFCLTK